MQYSADFVALGMHRADVRRAEHRLALRLISEERDSDGVDAPSGSAVRDRRRHGHAPRLAFR